MGLAELGSALEEDNFRARSRPGGRASPLCGPIAPRQLVRRILARDPLYALLMARAQRGRPITVLCYHTLRPDHEQIDVWTAVRERDFVRQMQFLRTHYDIVSLDEALANEGARSGRPRAVVTFDDGDAGLFDSMLPLVDELQIPVTLYIATGEIESGQPYWFDTVMNALQAEEAFTIDLAAAGLPVWTVGRERGPARWAVISHILEALKRAPRAALPALTSAVIAQAPPRREDGFKPLQPLSIAQLKELARSEWITIAAHSHCHNLLDRIPSADARASIQGSRRLLEDWIGKPVRHFAYPNGNHTAAVQAIVSEVGLVSAMALGGRLWRRGANPFALPRISIGRYDDFDRFKLRLAEV